MVCRDRKMKYKLKDIFDLQMGKTPSRNNIEFWIARDYKWISIADLTKTTKYISETKEYLSKSAAEESKIKVIPANTVVMSFKLSIGKVAITSEDMYSNEAIMAFHDKHIVEILPEYIFYMFKYKNWEEDSNKAVMGKTLNKASLSEIEINITPIEKQKEIVQVLNKMMDIISARENEIKLLDDLIKARFVEMFGDPSLPGKKYKLAKLGSVADVKSSHRVFTNEFVEEGIPFYRGTEISSLAMGQIPEVPYRISMDHYEKLVCDNSKPLRGDLLIPSICNKGQVWMVNTDEPFYYKDGRVLCISPDRSIFDSRYLQFYMKMRTEIEYPKLGSGSTFSEFKIFQLKDMIVDIPPVDIQKLFTLFADQVNKSKVAIQKALDEAQTLFDCLMQEYFG